MVHAARAAWVALAIALVAALAGGPGARRATGAEDSAAPPRGPAVQGVSATGYAHALGTVRVVARVRAQAPTPRTRLALFLSADRRGDAADRRLEGTIRVPALRRRASAAPAVDLRLPGDLAPATYVLVACPERAPNAAARGCRAAAAPVQVTAEPMTTRSLLAAAVARGEVDPGMALAYRVLGSVGDPRVPARFRGDDGPAGDSGALVEAVEGWAGLSPGARALIAPYFTPPAARGSWASSRPLSPAARPAPAASPSCVKGLLADRSWDSVVTANRRVRIWWDVGQGAAGAARARELRTEVDRVIWPRLSALFAPVAPLSDAGVECFSGDGKLDVYLTRVAGARALTVPYPPRCQHVPAFILVPPDVTGWELAHEMTHAFQFAHRYRAACGDYAWFDEGSANWGAHHAYPTDDTEHFWRWMLTEPGIGLPAHDYASWIFALYLEKAHDARLIPRIYAAFGSAPALQAIDATVPGGLDRAWPEFTRYAWNQAPLTTSFRQWDRVDDVPMRHIGLPDPLPTTNLALGGLRERTLQLPADLAGLSRSYRRMAVVEGENVRYLRLDNTLAGVPHAAVQAFVRMGDGSWRTEDWSGRRTVEFCRDDAAGDVREIVLMYSNSDLTTDRYLTPAVQPTMLLRDSCSELPLHFRVLAMSYEERASGSQTSRLVGCGVTSGTHEVIGVLPGPTTGAPAGRLEAQGAAARGWIRFAMPAGARTYRNRTRQGCRSNPGGPGYLPCTVSFPDSQPPLGGPWGLDLSLRPGEDTVRVHWPVNLGPQIGSLANATNAECNVGIVGTLPHDAVDTSAPLSTFTQREPFTLVSSGQRRLDRDITGHPADITFTWSYSITLQRVDENGAPRS